MGSRPPPLKNHENIRFLSNTGPDPLKNHKATKPAFNFRPSSARKRNAILMAFRWRTNDGPVIVNMDPPSPYQLKTKAKKKKKKKKKRCQSRTPLKNFLDPRMTAIYCSILNPHQHIHNVWKCSGCSGDTVRMRRSRYRLCNTFRSECVT